MEKIKQKIKEFQNEYRVKKQRRNVLKINYFEGLIHYIDYALQLKYDEEKNNIETITKDQKIREQQLEKLEKWFEKRQNKNDIKKVKLSEKVEKIKEKQPILEQHILDYNDILIEEEKQTLQKIEEDLEREELKPKQKEKLEWQKKRIQSKIKILDNDDIHLSVTSLKMFFGGVKAVNDLSFDVQKGEIFGLIGPNGAGKTTVFNCVTQFYRITDGYIYFRNKEEKVVNLSRLKSHQIVSEGLTRSFQNIELVWELNVLDNLLVAGHSQILSNILSHAFHSLKMKREEEILRVKAYEILKSLGIEEYALWYPMGLSYGILKKIELARTLMTDPTLIILDEPAAGLNEIETTELAQTIKEINQKYGITIFLVEHDMGLVMSISDRVCAISFGRKLAIGTPEEIKNNSEVRRAYLGDDDE